MCIRDSPYIAVIHCDSKASEDAAYALLSQRADRCVVKSKTAAAGSVEINYEIRLKDSNTDFVNELSQLNGVSSAVLVKMCIRDRPTAVPRYFCVIPRISLKKCILSPIAIMFHSLFMYLQIV